jgi:fucose 4-O-acetylase-like acetyltransferase
MQFYIYIFHTLCFKCHDHLAQLIDEILIYMTMTLQVQLMVTYVRLSDVKKIEHSDSVM